MFVAAHRARAPERSDRALILAADPDVRRWIEHELFGESVALQFVSTLAEIVGTLTLVPPPWPRLLVLDMTAVPPAEAPLLRTLRDAGWPGKVIAIGDLTAGTRLRLGIDRVLPRAFKAERLRNAVKGAGSEEPTVRIRRLPASSATGGEVPVAASGTGPRRRV